MYYVIVQSSQYNKHTFSFEKKKDAIDFVADQFEIRLKPVSYTHLDVYKRQGLAGDEC